VNILFVCLGNICRSPLAEGVFRKKVLENGRQQDFDIASAGTGAWHVGQPPDSRMISTARKQGCDISHQKAQQFVAKHLEEYDLILTMDASVQESITERFGHHPNIANVKLFREYDPQNGGDLDVPDPYYGAQDGFDEVWNIVNSTCDGLLQQVTVR
jgi:protein-tyrosine phosphatase